MQKIIKQSKIQRMRIYISPLKRLLEESNTTIAELSEAIKYHKSGLSRIANLQIKPSTKIAEDLVIFFKSKGFLNVNELIFLYPERYITVIKTEENSLFKRIEKKDSKKK